MYFKSNSVKVYPTSRRGYYSETDNIQKTFDPEARLETEYNKVNLYGKTPTKPSYLISWSNDLLKCVIGGYYFEIDTTETQPLKYLYIQTGEVVLVNNDVDSRKSKILKNIEQSSLVEALDGVADSSYYFYGLATTDDNPESLTEADNILKLKDDSGIINSNAYLIDSIFRTTNDKGSLNTAYLKLEDNTSKLLLNTNVGEYSYTLGEGLTNYGDNNLIIGIDNVVGNPSTSQDDNIIVGKNITSQFSSNILVGANINATSDNQIIIGDFENENIAADDQVKLFDTLTLKNDGVFVLKNKTTDSDASIFTLKNNANTDVFKVTNLGYLTTGSGIKANGSLTVTGTGSIIGKLTANNGIVVTTTDTDPAMSITGGMTTDSINVTGTADITGTLTCGVISSSDTITTSSTITGNNIKLTNDVVSFEQIGATIHGNSFNDSEVHLKDRVYIGSAGANIYYNSEKGCLEIIC